VSDCTVQATLSTIANMQRVFVRTTDANNNIFLSANTSGGQWELFKRVNCTLTALGTYAAAPASGDTVRIVLSGSSITVYINGTARITATDAFNQAATKHGLGASNSIVPRWSNFTVEV
jgi:predicted secreted protein